MLGIVGTVPDNDFGLAEGPVTLEYGHLVLGGRPVPIHRGTPALMGAAIPDPERIRPRPCHRLSGRGYGQGARQQTTV